MASIGANERLNEGSRSAASSLRLYGEGRRSGSSPLQARVALGQQLAHRRQRAPHGGGDLGHALEQARLLRGEGGEGEALADALTPARKQERVVDVRLVDDDVGLDGQRAR